MPSSNFLAYNIQASQAHSREWGLAAFFFCSPGSPSPSVRSISLVHLCLVARSPPSSVSSSPAPPVSGPCQQTDLVKEERLFAAQWMPCQGPSLPRLLYCVCRGLLTSTRDDTKEEEEGKGVMAVRTVLQWGRGDGGRQQ